MLAEKQNEVEMSQTAALTYVIIPIQKAVLHITSSLARCRNTGGLQPSTKRRQNAASQIVTSLNDESLYTSLDHFQNFTLKITEQFH